MRISDWSSDVCSSDLLVRGTAGRTAGCTRTILEHGAELLLQVAGGDLRGLGTDRADDFLRHLGRRGTALVLADILQVDGRQGRRQAARSEEHTSELQSLMRISYAVFCLKKKTTQQQYKLHHL